MTAESSFPSHNPVGHWLATGAHSTLFAGLLLTLGCQQVPGLDGLPSRPLQESDASSESGAATPSPVDDALDPDASSQEVEYHCDPGASGSCDPGQRCALTREDRGPIEFQCIDDPPVLNLWDPCTVRDDGADGCPGGSACIENGPGLEGWCTPVCDASGTCDNGSCRADALNGIPLCELDCDPIAADCPAQQICRQHRDGFGCSVVPEDARVETGGACDPVFDEGVCRDGLSCQSGARLIDCHTSFCCTELCDVDNPIRCESRENCLAFLPPPVSPNLVHVGACLIPAHR